MEGTYEHECMRAELLGIEKPNKEEFEKERILRLQNEQQEIEAAESVELEQQDESLKNTGGKLHELNSILSSTQQKLNRFKQTASGSLSNIFSRNNQNDSIDAHKVTADTNSEEKDTETALDVNDSVPLGSGVDIQPVISSEMIRNAKMDIQQKMTSHLSQLDSLLGAAEQAEISMAEQTKQMRKIAK